MKQFSASLVHEVLPKHGNMYVINILSLKKLTTVP